MHESARVLHATGVLERLFASTEGEPMGALMMACRGLRIWTLTWMPFSA